MKNDRGCRGIEYPKSARTTEERKEKLGSEPSKENKKREEKRYGRRNVCVLGLGRRAHIHSGGGSSVHYT